MGFIWDIAMVGFWFTAGGLMCVVLTVIVGGIAIKVFTDWEYKKVERRRKDATSK